MNKTINASVLLLFFLFAVFAHTLNSCQSGKDKSKLITKKWGIKDIEMDMDMSKKQKQQMDMLAKKMKKDAYYHFKSDGKYEIKSLARTETGTWKFSDDGSQIITTAEDADKEEKVDVEEITKEKLVISKTTKMGDMKMVLTPKEK